MSPPHLPATRLRRPASHRWALLIFFAAAGTNLMLAAHGSFDILGIEVTVASIAAIVGFFFFSRARATYLLGILTLMLVVFRALQTLWYDIAAYRQGLFRLPQEGQTALLATVVVMDGLLLLLAWKYVFGTASRRYYGLAASEPEPKADDILKRL